MGKTKKGWIAPIILISTFIVTRILHLTFLNPYHYSILAPEERYIGTIALELIQGLHFPLFEYQANSYLGGSLLMGAVSAIVFKFLGPSLFALKLPAILFSALTFFVWCLLISKYLGEGVARIFALLFIFSPPSFTQFSITTLGSHTEAMLFAVLSFYLAFEIISNRKQSMNYVLLLGFCCGFGIWLSYVNGLALISIILFWIAMERKQFFKTLPWLIPAFLIGLSPWFFYNLQNSMEGLLIYDKPLLAHFSLENLIAIFKNYRHFIGYHFFISLGKPVWGLSKDQILSSAFLYSFIYIIPAIICFIGLFKKQSDCKSHEKAPAFRFFLLYSFIYLGVAQFTEFHSARYFIPLYPVLFLFVSLALHRAENHFPKLQFKLIPIVCLLLVTAMPLSHAFLYSSNYIGQAFITKGYAYQNLHITVCKVPKKCLSLYENFLNDLSLPDLYDFSTELAIHTASEIKLESLTEQHNEIAPLIHPKFAPYFYYFFGQHLSEQRGSLEMTASDILGLGVSPEKEAQMFRGSFEQWGLGLADTEPLSNEQLLRLPEELIQDYWRASGERKVRAWHSEGLMFKELAQKAASEVVQGPEEYQKYFLEGFGKFLYDTWSTRPLNPPFQFSQVEALPENWHRIIFQGIGMGLSRREHLWRIASPEWYWQELTRDLSKTSQNSILKGKEVATLIFDSQKNIHATR